MTTATNGRVHNYHADASPLAGYLTHPSELELHTKGAVSLGPAGGHSEARAESFSHKDLMHSGAVYSQVTGSIAKTSRNWTTHVTSVIEKLNVLDIVTADKIVSTITVEHPHDGYYPSVSFAGSEFVNLRINGKPVTPTLDLGLVSLAAPKRKTHSSKEGDMLSDEATSPLSAFPGKAWPSMQSFVRKAVVQGGKITSAKGVPGWLKGRYTWMESAKDRTKKGYILCSLVSSVPDAAPGTSYGHVITVPNFGNVFLGELIVDPKSFQLTMMRIELASAASTGQTSFSAARTNGFPSP